MHPIERLRFIARVDDAPTALLVAEAAAALQATAADPMELLTACRRLVERRPSAGPLAWLAARMLASVDPCSEARAAVEAIVGDPTARRLAAALEPDAEVAVIGRGEIAGKLALPVSEPDDCSLALVESDAVCDLGALCVPGSAAAAALVKSRGVPLWLVAGVGRRLPRSMWESMRALCSADAAAGRAPHAAPEILPMDLFDSVAGPEGPVPAGQASVEPGCPPVAELFR